MAAPTPEEVRSALADLDPQREKMVAGLFALMVKNPDRVREREWVAEQLTQVVLMAGEFPADTPQDGVRAVQEYLAQNAEALVRATLLLFQRVGLDLAPRAQEGFGFEDAMRSSFEYLPSGTGGAGEPAGP